MRQFFEDYANQNGFSAHEADNWYFVEMKDIAVSRVPPIEL